MRRLPFPTEFADELKRVDKLHDPARTSALEALNGTIFLSLTRHLIERAQLASAGDDARSFLSPPDQIDQLRCHLAQENPYFALRARYKRAVPHNSVAEEWQDYLRQELGIESGEEIAFAQAMAELDKLLCIFHNRNLALPSLVFERIWFLHCLRGPERMAQTRAVLGMLTAELASCTSV
jgi:hypothetical protein